MDDGKNDTTYKRYGNQHYGAYLASKGGHVPAESCSVTCDDGLRCELLLGHPGSHVTHNGEHSFPRPTNEDPHPAGYTGEAGVKHDAGKRDWSLLPWDALESVVRVLEYGARKYSANNWRLVPDSTNRYRKALLRHVIAWCSGIENDEETGESHLAHAACCILFLLGKREAP